MWEHAATQANLATLRDRGVTVVDPGAGALATKHEWGVGRLAEPAELLAAFEAVRARGRAAVGRAARARHRRRHARADRRVRYVGNRSSGRMGFALADEAAALGADVTVVAANVALPRNPRVRYVDVGTAAELQAACEAAFDRRDVLLMAAAVADFRPPPPRPRSSRRPVATRCASTSSPPPTCWPALARAGARARRSSASPPSTATARWTTARDKLRAQGPRRGRASTTSRGQDIGFDGADNEVTIVTADGEQHVPRAAKAEVARAILAAVDELRAGAARARRAGSMRTSTGWTTPRPSRPTSATRAWRCGGASTTRSHAAVEVRPEVCSTTSSSASSPRATS